MTTYDILNSMEKSGVLTLLVQKGIVPITFLDYKVIYSKYLQHRRTKKKMESYEGTAIDCSVSEKTVRLVVKAMES